MPRHPSELYEAALEGLGPADHPRPAGARRRIEASRPRDRRVRDVYAVMRSFCEFFREPDPQLGFLWGGMTMGMLLCVPLFVAGVALHARRAAPRAGASVTAEDRTPLEAEIRRRIARDGPMPVAEFMALCLYDPEHGYYNRRAASAPPAISSRRRKSARCSAN